ncbi:hypothetical protein GF323_01825 [Candidatus Woesearchaeota archaeon]|nr:hypothetical protein [Candidatus Woesearchaeota archaeon]
MKNKKNISYKVFFAITSILLIIFHASICIKTCHYPIWFSLNMIMLYIALVIPFILIRIKNPALMKIILIAYLIYFAITFGGFLSYISNPGVNCDWYEKIKASRLIYRNMTDFI